MKRLTDDEVWKMAGEFCGIIILLNLALWLVYGLVCFVAWCGQIETGETMHVARIFITRFNLTLLPVAFLMAVQARSHYAGRRKT